MATAAGRAPERATRTDSRPTLRPVPDTEPGERDRQRRYYLMHLRASTNRRGQPYSERTIGAYEDAVTSLDRHLAVIGFVGDYTDLTAEVLNTYFSAYRAAHGQGGTVTKQGNLRPFCTWLAEEFDLPDPYTDRALNRYAWIAEPPPVLAEQIVTDLLAVTKGKSLEDIRDTCDHPGAADRHAPR